MNSPRISDPQPWRFCPAAYMRLDDDELVLLCPTLLKSVRVPGFCSGEGASSFVTSTCELYSKRSSGRPHRISFFYINYPAIGHMDPKPSMSPYITISLQAVLTACMGSKGTAL